MKKTISIIISLVISVLLFAGCGKETVKSSLKSYNLPEQITSIKSGVISENDNLRLSWDFDKQCIIIYDKNNDNYWSSMPYDYYSSGENATGYKANGICSSLKITYLDAKNKTENELNSFSDAPYQKVIKSDTGVRIIYYFDKAKISVPITFILEEDHISVSVENALIEESENKIISVSLLPFFVSAPNDSESYLFVPSGSGALMYTDDSQRNARKYSEPVFGGDLSAQTIYHNTENESVRMPVFGAKNVDGGIFAIITSAAETSQISAISGDNQYGFSGVYPTFKLRGSASSLVKGSANTNFDITKYSNDVSNISKSTVKYYFLSKDKSDYNGMAECYRNFLTKNGDLKDTKNYANALITMLGGIEERKLFLGLPYHTISSVTDFSQCEKIIKDITVKTDADLVVNLKGFGSSGLDYGETAGGFKPDKIFGGEKALKKLNKSLKKTGTELFYDFDMIYQTKSYKEFKLRDSALSANDIRARYCEYDIVTREQSDDCFAYLTNRLALAKSSGIISEKIKDLSLLNVGLSSLSNSAYSDYSDRNYFCKAYMSDDVNRILESLRKQGIKTFGEKANSYAAARLDYVYNSPSSSSKYFSLDKDVPFYQLVFRGSTVLSGKPINLSTEPRIAFLESVSTGSALGFSLCNNYNDTVFKTVHSAIALSVYDGISTMVNDFIKEAMPLQKKLNNAKLVKYNMENNLSVSEFDNGTVVFVNYGDETLQTGLGEVKPQSFIFK